MYNPPFTVSAEAINMIAEISALLERHNIAVESEHELRLRKANRIKTIHSSLAIEGNTLSEDEVSAIVNGKNVVAPLRQIQEVKNAIRVYDNYSSFNPLRESDLRKAHGIMMEALADDAGHYRSKGVGVFGEKGLVHMAPKAAMVPELMGNLFDWLKRSKDHILIQSCVFHYEFEFIHPFSDGNGRMGRLWQSLLLGRLNPIFEHLPVENIVYANQSAYYDAIAASTVKADAQPFIDFMLSEILKTLKEFIKDKVSDKLSIKVSNKSELKVLLLLKTTPSLTQTELAEMAELSLGAVKKVLIRLRENGVIERIGSNKTGKWKVNPYYEGK